MKMITTFLLMLLLALAVSSCGHRYGHYSGGHGYTRVYESTLYPAVYVRPPYPAYSVSYVGGNYYGGGMGGGMH